MTYNELYKALNHLSVETGSLACLGCEYENRCSIAGCAILRAAAEALQRLQTKNQRLSTALTQSQKIKKESDDFESDGYL